MSKKPFSGAGINLDLNTIGEVVLLRPFGVKANIIVDQFGGDQGNCVITALEVALSSLVFNAMMPLDSNVVYLGDGSVQSNTPWKMASNCPTGWMPNMEWYTDILKFHAADNGPMTVALKPHGNGDFQIVYSFVFYLMVLRVGQTGTIFNQTTTSRGILDYDHYEVNGLHGTQTRISAS